MSSPLFAAMAGGAFFVDQDFVLARDPLGRATRNDGGMDTRGVEVPEESDLGRARDVLEELYRRSGDRSRPSLELDYYRRLLDRF